MNSDFLVLKHDFETELENFLNSERNYKPAKQYGNIAELEGILTELENFLLKFGDLHYNIAIEVASDIDNKNKPVTLDAIRVVMTRIEYLYLAPYNHRLNFLTNKKNLIIAYVAIALSLVGIGISLVPFLIADQQGEILKEIKQVQTMENVLLKQTR